MRRLATGTLLAVALGLAAGPSPAAPPAESGLHVTQVARQGATLRVDFLFRNVTGGRLDHAFVRCSAFDADGNRVGTARTPLGPGRAPGATEHGTVFVPARGTRPVIQACTLERRTALPAAPAPPGDPGADFREDPPPGAWLAPSGGCAYDRYSRELVWSVPARSCLPVWPPALRMD
jgi:hypothetical protein